MESILPETFTISTGNKESTTYLLHSLQYTQRSKMTTSSIAIMVFFIVVFLITYFTIINTTEEPFNFGYDIEMSHFGKDAEFYRH